MQRIGIIAAYVMAFVLAGMSIAAALDATLAPSPQATVQDIAKVRVSPAGGAIKGSAGTSSQRLNTGTYAVRFGSSVRECIYSATLSHKRTLTTPVDGGGITVTPRYSNEKEVIVQTFADANTKEDHGFDLVVFCNADPPASTAPLPPS